MNYAIVYSSKTGNTQLLAQAARELLPEENLLYFGAPCSDALKAERIYVGFWTDKGRCDDETAKFLSSLTNQKVFLFGTAGFGGSDAYFQKILTSVQEFISPTVTIVGTYMCQGKMPPAVRLRYESMEDTPARQAMLDNFDAALSHPNQEDLNQLKGKILDSF